MKKRETKPHPLGAYSASGRERPSVIVMSAVQKTHPKGRGQLGDSVQFKAGCPGEKMTSKPRLEAGRDPGHRCLRQVVPDLLVSSWGTRLRKWAQPHGSPTPKVCAVSAQGATAGPWSQRTQARKAPCTDRLGGHLLTCPHLQETQARPNPLGVPWPSRGYSIVSLGSLSRNTSLGKGQHPPGFSHWSLWFICL